STFRPNQRMCRARERVLHIKGVHVQLEVSFGADLLLDVINGWYGATADVVRDAAPAHRRPIDDLHSGNERAGAFAAHELLQGLEGVEGSRSSVSRNDH